MTTREILYIFYSVEDVFAKVGDEKSNTIVGTLCLAAKYVASFNLLKENLYSPIDARKLEDIDLKLYREWLDTQAYLAEREIKNRGISREITLDDIKKVTNQ